MQSFSYYDVKVNTCGFGFSLNEGRDKPQSIQGLGGSAGGELARGHWTLKTKHSQVEDLREGWQNSHLGFIKPKKGRKESFENWKDSQEVSGA